MLLQLTEKMSATIPSPTECGRLPEITEYFCYYPPPPPNLVGCKQFAFAIRAKLGLTPQMDVGPYAYVYPGRLSAAWSIVSSIVLSYLVPNMAKLAKIISIYKAKDKKDISNYRPISLLPVISKILEKVVNKKCVYFS